MGKGRPTLRRAGALAVAAAVLAAAVILPARSSGVRAVGPCDPPVTNPIACENSKTGNPPSEWDVNSAGDLTIQGFATNMSVNKGTTESFKINTPASAYSITIYRIGYYGGMGARQIATVTPSAPLPQNQPSCLSDSTGILDCGNWGVSASWAVPSDAVSGVYVARLRRTDTGGASHIIFVVRDDSSTSDLLFQTSDSTWQAYNRYGGNSLYSGTAPLSDDGRAYKVSYNRPFTTRSDGASNFFFYGEYPMVRFLEANGYNVSYFTDIDSDRNGALIRNHKVFMSVGHDEYWSGGQRANVEAARAAGVNLAFFSGNESFWKTRWENSIDGSGTTYRTLVTYKETKPEKAIDPQDPPTWTGTWRDKTLSPPADGGRPENAMTGTIFMVNQGTSAITVPYAYSRMRLWRNTSIATLSPGQTATLATDTLGYEWDEDLDNGARPAGLVRLSSTTVSVPQLLMDNGNTYGPGTATHNLTLYHYPGGGLVFGAGTVQWAWGLDVSHDLGPDTGSSTPDVRMQQATVNLFADMGVQPATLISGLVAATASTDTTPPTSTITSPANGASFSGSTNVTITGTASDAGGGLVGGVEVSVDGGTTWHPANGTTNWTYSWTTGRPGPVTIKSRAVDDSANQEVPSAGVNVTIAGSTAPQFLSKATVQNGTTVNNPGGGIQPGDLMLTLLEVDSDPVTVTQPGGWTLLLDTPVGVGTSSAFHSQVWYKVATDRETPTYSWNVGGAYCDIAVLAYINVNKTSPIDVANGRDAGVVTTATTNAVTTNFAGDMLVAAFADYNFGSYTAGSGMTQRFNFDSNEAQDAVQAAVGSTGTKSATNTASGRMSAQIIALRPLLFDSQPPTATMTAPANGSSVSGNVTVSANASDNVGVTSVQFLLDGAPLGASQTAAPYTMSWDSTTVANGTHTLGAKAQDAAGNVGTAPPVTVTVNNPPPQITNVQSTGVTSSAATISWNTDHPADSQVSYGTASGTYTLSSTLDPTLVSSHSQTLSALASNTTYYYLVKSRDISGQQTTSGESSFTTTAVPPSITNVQATSITASGATISWTTDVPADSQVDYGPSGYSSSTPLDPTLVTSHSQSLIGLTPGTLYHYRVDSRNGTGTLATSGDFTFSTPYLPPVITNTQATGITSSGATISWTTDHPADSQVDYGPTAGYGSSTTLDTTKTVSHSQTLINLAANTQYHYQVKSRDTSNNLTIAGDFTFTTPAAAPTPPAFRSKTNVANGRTATKPTGVVAGDLLLAALEVDADPVTVTGPAGWTLLLDTPTGSGTASAFHAQVWYKVATATEPTSYTWTIPAGIWTDVQVLAYSNVNASTPIDVASGRDAGTTSAPTTSAVTTTAGNDMVVAIFINYDLSSWTAGSGMTQRTNFDSNTAQDVVQLATGTTGTKTATNSMSGRISAQIITLRAK